MGSIQLLQTCSDTLDKITASYTFDTSSSTSFTTYQLQSTPGYCGRSTDGFYDPDNLTTMYESGASVQDCAAGCDADETCVAFDYSPDGYCYAYKQDPLADYVGQSDASTQDW